MNTSLLDYIYNRCDITPLSGFEREVWLGEYVECEKCHTKYVMAVDQEWGWCRSCTYSVDRRKKQMLQNMIRGDL